MPTAKAPSEVSAPSIAVKIYRDGQLVERRFCGSEEEAARVVESWEATPPAHGEVISVEPHPPEDIVALLRAIADAIERGEPVAMPTPAPPVRLQPGRRGPARARQPLGTASAPMAGALPPGRLTPGRETMRSARGRRFFDRCGENGRVSHRCHRSPRRYPQLSLARSRFQDS